MSATSIPDIAARLGLLSTKLQPPEPRERMVARPALSSMLDAGAEVPLTLVSAPAGFGKTTAVAVWSRDQLDRETARRVAWLSLDAEESDPAAFLAYFAAACTQLVDDAEEAVRAVSTGSVTPRNVLTLLVNGLAGTGAPCVLVLEDYHVISDHKVHRFVASFLERAPENVHVVIVTRADPALPLARLRATGKLVEIRAEDLRFSADEAGAFLRDVMQVSLSDDQVRLLDERTEGWVAGLQLAALSLAGSDDAGSFVAEFSGSHRFILDYLVEEVLEGLAQDQRRFLLQTAILRRFCAELCDAVTGRQDSAAQLSAMDDANLFLVPLDQHRRWFRYHHLFRDLLAARMPRHEAPELDTATLHARAAEWFQAHGLRPEAIHHASAAGEHHRAAMLVQEELMEAWGKSRLGRSMHLVDELPPEVVRTYPWLLVITAWNSVVSGKHTFVSELLDQAEAAVPTYLGRRRRESSDETRRGERDRLAGFIAAIRAYQAQMERSYPQAVALALRARDLLDPSSGGLWNTVSLMLGISYILQGDYESGEKVLESTMREGLRRGATNIIGLPTTYRCRLRVEWGRLREAQRICAEAIARIEEADPRDFHLAGSAYGAASAVYREWNQLERARQLWEQGHEYNVPWYTPTVKTAAMLDLSRIVLAEGDLSAAREIMDRAAAETEAETVQGDLRAALDAWRIQLHLEAGDTTVPHQWRAEHPEPELQAADPVSVHRAFTHLRICLHHAARGAAPPEGTVRRAAALCDLLQRVGRFGLLIEALTLYTRALALTDLPQAMARAAEALERGRDEGFVRTYLDAGEGFRRVALQAGGVPDLAAEFAESAGFKALSGTARPAAGATHSPLSERETEVLGLLARGFSNREMAEELFVSVGTIKTHVHNIMDKLAADNRTHAVAEARARGLIS